MEERKTEEEERRKRTEGEGERKIEEEERRKGRKGEGDKVTCLLSWSDTSFSLLNDHAPTRLKVRHLRE